MNQKIKEKQKLEEEIQKARAILDQENLDLQIIQEFKKLKEELKKYGLSIGAPHKLVSVLQKFSEMGNDSQKNCHKSVTYKILQTDGAAPEEELQNFGISCGSV